MSISVTNFGDYSVKSIKSFMGREGLGFNANLYRGKKKVAFLRDDANGGEVDIDWVTGKNPQTREDYPTEIAWNKAWAKYHSANKVESDLLDTHLKTLPNIDSNYEGVEPLVVDAGWFVTDLVSKWESEKDLRKMQRQCRTKTLFRQSNAGQGRYQILNAVCDDAVRARLHRDFGQEVEIFNDVLANNETPSVLI